jgi:hypothetical protein
MKSISIPFSQKEEEVDHSTTISAENGVENIRAAYNVCVCVCVYIYIYIQYIHTHNSV